MNNREMNRSRATAMLLSVAAALAPAWGEEGESLVFERDVRPILRAHCTHCHGEEEKPGGGVDLRLRRFMDLELGAGVRLLIPGDPGGSELVRIVRRGEMPKKGHRVPEEEIEILERWIEQGAITAREEPLVLEPGTLITEEDRAHWAFQPVLRPEVPEPAGEDEARSPVDAFLLATMREEGLSFAPEAERRVLIRRLSLDLTGILPEPEEVEAFVADPDPDAYERLVDRLLDSPAYGERWARHWLDVAGYADSNGYAEADSARPHAWRYRDYVIRAFNEDKPWDQFIQEQLAGDELAGVTHGDYFEAVVDPRRLDQLTATAFLRMAPDGTGDPVDDQNLARNQVIAEQLKIVSSSLLGLTVACAQCHDHRYDPVTQKDYFRLRAVFDPAYHWEAWRPPAQRHYSLYTPEERAEAAGIERAAARFDAEARELNQCFLDDIFEEELLKLPEEDREPYRLARATPKAEQSPEQAALIRKHPSALALYSLNLYSKEKQDLVDAVRAEASALRATKPPESFVMALTEVKGQVPESKLHHRGDHEQATEPVAPGELAILAGPGIEPFEPAELESGSSGRRLAYARWLTSGEHPLVARVLVNRFWMHHMGRGIVNTPGDFGMQGETPSHPELLDWLADEFVSGGWRLKPLHRTILLSAAYRQSAENPNSLERDPENRFYARYPLRRLDAESLRDSVLAAAGTLVRTPYGPPSSIARDPAGRIVVGVDKGTISKAEVASGGEKDFRRSIYVEARRSRPVTVLETFDSPVMEPHCERRAETTVAPQSLLLMNDVFILENARRLAERLRAEAPDDLPAQLRLAWRVLYGESPAESEVARSLHYLEAQAATLAAYHEAHPSKEGEPGADPDLEALASLCQVLYSSNRFLYLE